MVRPVFIALAFAASAIAINNKAQINFCPLLERAITAAHEQGPATSFCSSFLHISTACTTKTVTRTGTVTKTSTSTITRTAPATVTTVATATTRTGVTITTTATTSLTSTIGTTVTSTATVGVTSTTGATVTNTATAAVTITSATTVTTNTVVATSTSFTSTSTQINILSVTTGTTVTSTSTSTVPLAGCTRPVFVAKREIEERSIPKPSCFKSLASSALSQACSCLSIPHPTATRTVSASTTRTVTSIITATSTVTRTSTLTSTQTTTIKSTVPATATTSVVATVSTTVTAVVSSTVSATATTTGTVTTTTTATTVVTPTSTVTNSVTTTITTDFTITSQSTSTFTSTATATATAQRFSDFALLHSGKGLYGSIIDSVGGSGQGVYFDEGDLGTAATFSFTGTKLYYDNQYTQGYAASSGNYYVVVERPYAQFGYYMDCSLGTPSFSGDGCPLTCQIGGGFFDLSTGNDETNYGGAWGFQGNVDNFIVYAVGQT